MCRALTPCDTAHESHLARNRQMQTASFTEMANTGGGPLFIGHIHIYTGYPSHRSIFHWVLDKLLPICMDNNQMGNIGAKNNGNNVGLN